MDVKDNRGWQSLHEAALIGHLECIKLILKKGAEVDCRTFEEQTPLMFACKRGHTACVKYLLKKGADPNSETLEGFTPLWEATQTSPKCINALLKAGADVNHQTFTGETALHRAMYGNYGEHLRVTKTLLESDPDISIQDENGLTALFCAAQFGLFECLMCLIEYAESKGEEFKLEIINKTANDNASPLYLAVQNNHTECVRLLLSHGADPDIYVPNDGIKIYPLQVALLNGDEECSWLLAERTNLENFTWLNYTEFPEYYPLVIACAKEDETFLNILLRQPWFENNLSEDGGNGMFDLLKSINLFRHDMKIKPAVVLYKKFKSSLKKFFQSRDFIFAEYEETISTSCIKYYPVFLLMLRLGARPFSLNITSSESVILLYWCAVMKYSTRNCHSGSDLLHNTSACQCCNLQKTYSDVYLITRTVRELLAVITSPLQTMSREEGLKARLENNYTEVVDIGKLSTLQHLCRRATVLRLLHTSGYCRHVIQQLDLPKPLHKYLLFEDMNHCSSILDSFDKLENAEKDLDRHIETVDTGN